MPQQDLVILFSLLGLHDPSDSGPHPGIIGDGPNDPHPGYSIPHLGLTLTRDLWSHSGPQTKLVTLVPLWASPLRGDSGHPLGFTWAWGIWSLAGPHMDLGTGRHLGLTWAW